MMRKLRWWLLACGCFTLILYSPSSAAGQSSDSDYKSLYAAAEYDKALAAVSSLDTIEAQQYKALCLLALGRQADASAAIEALVNTSPTFTPSAEDAPPRFVELVTKTRQKLLPVIARRVFTEGRERYTIKQTDEAVSRFSLVLTLLSDPAFTDATTKQDLETLAKGFIDLANAAAPPKPVAPVAPAPTPAPAPAAKPVVMPKVVLPSAISQPVPPIPTDLASLVVAKLVLVIQIDEMGKVTGASVRESAHPRYDRLVVQASRDWRYTPATRDGVPIPSEQIITIQPKR